MDDATIEIIIKEIDQRIARLRVGNEFNAGMDAAYKSIIDWIRKKQLESLKKPVVVTTTPPEEIEGTIYFEGHYHCAKCFALLGFPYAGIKGIAHWEDTPAGMQVVPVDISKHICDSR